MLPSRRFLPQLEDVEEEYNKEVEEIIYNILSDRASGNETQKFIKSITTILYKETKELIELYHADNIEQNKQNRNYNCAVQQPSINLYIMQPPQMQPIIASNPVNQYPQPNINPMIPPNYSYNPNQMTTPMQFLQPSFPISIPPVKHKHKSKEKSKSSKKKDKSKKKAAKTKETKKKTTNSKTKEFLYQVGTEFKGIFNYLQSLKYGNIHENGTINVIASSVNRYSISKCGPEYAVDLNSDKTAYKSSNEEKSWICFDFKERKVKPFAYQILSNNDTDFGQLRSWVIEVSNDNNSWLIIDEKYNSSILRRSRYIATFQIEESKLKDFYRYIRLRQTDISWHSGGKGYLMNIPKIEFYGKLIDI